MKGRLDRLQLVGVPGSNKIMAGELSRLCRRALTGVRLDKPTKLGSGAVAFRFDPSVALVALHYHRTSSRILWDLFESRSKRLEPLYRELAAAIAADERAWCWSGATFSIRPRNLQRFGAGVRQVVGTVKNAIVDGARERGVRLEVAPKESDLLVSVRQHDDAIIVSLDLDGRARHQRGYRLDAGEAPLRENLAAVLVMLARYDPRRDVVVDPMAGSGTIAIEAALMARGEPLRKQLPDVSQWPDLANVVLEGGPLFADADAKVFCFEIDDQTARAARSNASRAGVSLSVETADFRDRAVPRLRGDQRGLIVTNPPYGRRLKGDTEALHRDFADWCSRAAGYRVAVLVEDPQFERIFARRARVKKPLANASARTYFYLFD